MEHLFLVPSSWAEWKHWFTNGAPQLAGIIVGLFVINILFRKLVSRVLHRAIERAVRLRRDDTVAVERRVNTLLTTLTWLFTIFIAFIGTSLILDNLGLNVSALVASVGIAGVAIGLGSQTLIKDVINGTFILIEDQYRAGDVVKVAGVSGAVIEVNPRRTVLRDQDGNVHTIPNSAITVTTNMTQGFSSINLDLVIPYETDIRQAIKVIDQVCGEVAAAHSQEILTTPAVLRVDAFGDTGVVVKVTGNVRAGSQWALTGELRERLKVRFDDDELEFGPRARSPFPWTAGARAERSE
jgi:small conductance mechanosensitive channel